jgi:hypothetical protein
MSKATKLVIAASLIASLGAAAFASDATEWIMKPDYGYVVDKSGKVSAYPAKIDNAAMARAEEVKPSTAFFVRDGKVMAVDRSLIGLGSH